MCVYQSLTEGHTKNKKVVSSIRARPGGFQGDQTITPFQMVFIKTLTLSEDERRNTINSAKNGMEVKSID